MRRVARRIARRSSDESGVVIVIVAIFMVVILGCAALAIDVGSWYAQKRNAQAAADAAALAAVQDLPSSSTATATAQSYAGKNGFPNATVSVDTTNSKVTVNVSKSVPAFFGRALGITGATVTASATAEANSSYNAAVFAADSSCTSSLTINGVLLYIPGWIHSNGSFRGGVLGGDFGPTTYGCNNNFINWFGTVHFQSGPAKGSSTDTWPEDYSNLLSNSNCTYGSLSRTSGFSWSGVGGSIPSGVYCTSGTVSLSGGLWTVNNVAGKPTGVTFIAGGFDIDGALVNLQPASTMNNLLLYQTGTGTVSITTAGFLGGGSIFAPNGSISISGIATAVSGFIEAQDISINAAVAGFSFTGTGPVQTGGSLVQ